MDKADGTGLSVAVVGHVALFAALSLGLASWTPPKPPTPPAMEVEFVDEVSPTPAAPAVEARTAQAPEVGPPDEATPAEAMPEPAPVAEPLPPPPPVQLAPPPPPPAPVAKPIVSKPKPTPAPGPSPKPAPKPVKRPPVTAKPAPAPVKLAPAKSVPKPAPAKKAVAAPAKKPVAAPAAKTKAPPAKVASAQGAGRQQTGTRRSPLSLPGVSELARGEAKKAAPAVAMTKQASANIGSAILKQVQPCANQQVKPGPGAERIRVTINLRLNRDGSLAARPRVTDQTGIDDENRRYADRVNDLAINTFTKCAPLRGLPADLYDVAKGWSNFSLRYKLPA